MKQAFPVAYSEQQDFHAGMTLRDYFAAAALQGMLCNGFQPDQVGNYKQPKSGEFHYEIAAYQLADAMLKARDL